MERNVMRYAWRRFPAALLRLVSLAVCGMWACPLPAAAVTPKVHFDMLRVVGCTDVTTEEFAAANPGERLLQAKLEISSLVVEGGEESLLQYLYRITSPERTLQVVDFRPRTTPASDYAGNVTVEKKSEATQALGLSLNGAWDHLVKANGTAETGAKDSSSVRYELVPPQGSVAASGTILRGFGVYFKLKRMRQSLLEGAKELVVVFRAPSRWRGDYLQVHCEATGRQKGVVRQLDEEVLCGQADFLVALYLAGDEEAKQIAERFVDAASELRRSAAEHRGQIHRQSYPTVLHEFGVLIGAVRPRISETWLSEVIYPSPHSRLEEITARLPNDVRLAAQQYVAARAELQRLRQ